MTRVLPGPAAASGTRVRSLARHAQLLGPLAGLAPLLLGALLDVPQAAQLGHPQSEPGFGCFSQSFGVTLTAEHFWQKHE
jgi:hypothetical protein